MAWLVDYLTGEFAYAAELQCFWMAFQGSMAVRNGRNRDKKMAWFHSFMLSVFSAYSGSTFTKLFVGQPSSILSSDLSVASCILAFLIVNYIPKDIGFKLGNTLPVVLITTLFSQLFRVQGVTKYVEIGFATFQDKATPYYPIPIFGPIIFATCLGNMGGFFLKGFDAYLAKGMPWPFQNGLCCATFYHFYVNDETGFIGVTLRAIIDKVDFIKMGMDDKTFAIVAVSSFMHVMGVLQLSHCFGPSFSPFHPIPNYLPDFYNDLVPAESTEKKTSTKKDQ